MKNILILILFLFILGCTKMQEKNTTGQNKDMNKQNIDTLKTDTNIKSQNKSQKDEKAVELTKAAEESIENYNNDKSENNKKTVVTSCMVAANYLMFEANLPAREKYRPALKYYRKVLELDPKNQEAVANKKQIEDIYESMGMPIPQ